MSESFWTIPNVLLAIIQLSLTQKLELSTTTLLRRLAASLTSKFLQLICLQETRTDLAKDNKLLLDPNRVKPKIHNLNLNPLQVLPNNPIHKLDLAFSNNYLTHLNLDLPIVLDQTRMYLSMTLFYQTDQFRHHQW